MNIEYYEAKLYQNIKELYDDIKSMKPSDGFNSPRDINLLRELNKKVSIMDKLQEAMQSINPHFEIRD